MNYEQQALELIKENEALKAQVNNAVSLLNRQLDNPTPEEYVDQELTGDTLSFIQSTPEQYLNSVKADAISDFINKVADMQVKGGKGTVKVEYYKAALRHVFLRGVHEVTKLRGNNEKSS